MGSSSSSEQNSSRYPVRVPVGGPRYAAQGASAAPQNPGQRHFSAILDNFSTLGEFIIAFMNLPLLHGLIKFASLQSKSKPHFVKMALNRQI